MYNNGEDKKKRVASEPKGHFNKRVIGDPQKLSKKLRGSLDAKESELPTH